MYSKCVTLSKSFKSHPQQNIDVLKRMLDEIPEWILSVKKPEKAVPYQNFTPTKKTSVSVNTAGVAPSSGVSILPVGGHGLASSSQSRFDILKGEVLAGNNSKVLINELKRMIHKLVQDGTLNYSDAMSAIDDLNNI